MIITFISSREVKEMIYFIRELRHSWNMYFFTSLFTFQYCSSQSYVSNGVKYGISIYNQLWTWNLAQNKTGQSQVICVFNVDQRFWQAWPFWAPMRLSNYISSASSIFDILHSETVMKISNVLEVEHYVNFQFLSPNLQILGHFLVNLIMSIAPLIDSIDICCGYSFS